MAKPKISSLRTFALVLAGFGIGNTTSALELAAITNSEDSIFRNYAIKGIVILFVAWLISIYVRKQSSKQTTHDNKAELSDKR